MAIKKIELFTRRRFKPRDADSITWEFSCCTMQSKTCKEAKQRFCKRFGLSEDQVKASFAVK